MASKKTTIKRSERNGIAEGLAVPDAKAPRLTAKKPRGKASGAVLIAQATASDVPATTQAASPAKATKALRSKKTAAQPRKVSALDAAAKVLQEGGQPLNCTQMIEAMAAKGYWTSPAGKTPSATLYAAIAREIKLKGKAARFTKAERGLFAFQTAKAS